MNLADLLLVIVMFLSIALLFKKHVEYQEELKRAEYTKRYNAMAKALAREKEPRQPVKLNTPKAPESAEDVRKIAESYMNTPHAWGGGRPVGYMEGRSDMDCASLIAWIYHDCRIDIISYTPKMSDYGYRIEREQVQIGDLGLFGKEDNAYHVIMALDKDTAICCGEQPRDVVHIRNIDENPPSFWIRVPEMDKIVNQ